MRPAPALVALVALAGCTAAAPPPECTVTGFEAFAAQYADALCDYGPAARASIVHARGYWPADCARELDDALQQSDFAYLRQAIALGRTTFDAARGSDCLCALRAGGAHLALPRACLDVFVGHVPVGAHCALDAECAPAGRCSESDLLACGTCVRVQVAGDPCLTPTDCVGRWPMRCVQFRCAEQSDLGAPCATGDCLAGAVCSASTSGTCIDDTPPRGALGDDCNHGVVLCADDLVCVDTGDGAHCDRPAAAATCRPVIGEGSDCAPGFSCDGVVGQTGRCLGWSQLGRCGPEGICDPGYRCGLGAARCVPSRNLGEPCDEGTGACVSHVCLNGVCDAPGICF